MMRAFAPSPSWTAPRSWLPAALLWLGVALLAAFPAPLAAAARLYHALCAPFPALALLGRIVPPLPLAFLLLLILTVGGVGLASGAWELIATRRLTRGLQHLAAPIPQRLAHAARSLELKGSLTYLATPALAAFCYGLFQTRIAISAGLLDRLDDEELTAVLLHERHHLRNRDPLRYLVLQTLAAGLFMIPLTPAVRRSAETRLELAADRAALGMVPRGALAGALAVALTFSSASPAGIAPLTATEARIAHLVGRPEHPTVPIVAGLATMGLIAALGLAVAWLARPEEVWEIVCALCP
jgi:Zn-dependent protease with chaperone function